MKNKLLDSCFVRNISSDKVEKIIGILKIMNVYLIERVRVNG